MIQILFAGRLLLLNILAALPISTHQSDIHPKFRWNYAIRESKQNQSEITILYQYFMFLLIAI
jgi:hypothetical protein